MLIVVCEHGTWRIVFRIIRQKHVLHAYWYLMDPWQLIKEGRFADAVDAYTQQLTETRTAFSFRNRAIAHLNLGQLDLALADFESAEEIDKSQTDANLKSLGVVHWLSGHETDAVKCWKKAVDMLERKEIQYTDGAGGVQSASLLWFAGKRLRNVSLQKSANHLLKKLLKSRRSRNWPGPIGRLLLQQIDADSLRSLASTAPVLRERELCQVEFYISMQLLEHDTQQHFLDSLQRATAHSAALIECEFYLAQDELRRALLRETP